MGTFTSSWTSKAAAVVALLLLASMAGCGWFGKKSDTTDDPRADLIAACELDSSSDGCTELCDQDSSFEWCTPDCEADPYASGCPCDLDPESDECTGDETCPEGTFSYECDPEKWCKVYPHSTECETTPPDDPCEKSENAGTQQCICKKDSTSYECSPSKYCDDQTHKTTAESQAKANAADPTADIAFAKEYYSRCPGKIPAPTLEVYRDADPTAMSITATTPPIVIQIPSSVALTFKVKDDAWRKFYASDYFWDVKCVNDGGCPTDASVFTKGDDGSINKSAYKVSWKPSEKDTVTIKAIVYSKKTADATTYENWDYTNGWATIALRAEDPPPPADATIVPQAYTVGTLAKDTDGQEYKKRDVTQLIVAPVAAETNSYSVDTTTLDYYQEFWVVVPNLDAGVNPYTFKIDDEINYQLASYPTCGWASMALFPGDTYVKDSTTGQIVKKDGVPVGKVCGIQIEQKGVNANTPRSGKSLPAATITVTHGTYTAKIKIGGTTFKTQPISKASQHISRVKVTFTPIFSRIVSPDTKLSIKFCGAWDAITNDSAQSCFTKEFTVEALGWKDGEWGGPPLVNEVDVPSGKTVDDIKYFSVKLVDELQHSHAVQLWLNGISVEYKLKSDDGTKETDWRYLYWNPCLTKFMSIGWEKRGAEILRFGPNDTAVCAVIKTYKANDGKDPRIVFEEEKGSYQDPYRSYTIGPKLDSGGTSGIQWTLDMDFAIFSRDFDEGDLAHYGDFLWDTNPFMKDDKGSKTMLPEAPSLLTESASWQGGFGYVFVYQPEHLLNYDEETGTPSLTGNLFYTRAAEMGTTGGKFTFDEFKAVADEGAWDDLAVFKSQFSMMGSCWINMTNVLGTAEQQKQYIDDQNNWCKNLIPW